MSEILNT